MKKSISRLFLVGAISSLALVSCNNDDDNKGEDTNPSGFVANPQDFKGELKSGDKVTLDASKVYYLTGSLQVDEGAVLTIPAGTQIIANGGTSSYIAVAQGGQIFANGTADKPVVFSSDKKTPGSWGGVVLCGKAPINIAKSATAEVSQLTYGGDVSNDNSGTITYTRIEYAGAIYNSQKEFNGLSLFGVGSGTKIEYVQLYAGSDDGVEFFGGTVNTKYIVSNENEDDQFDWTEGWNGTNEFWYGKEGRSKGNRGIEADNNSSNNLLTPISNPTIKNATLIGLGSTYVGEGENQALKLRVGTKGKFENFVLANWAKGIDIEHDATLSWIPTDLFLKNVQFINVGVEATGKTSGGAVADVTKAYSKANNTGAGSGVDTPTWAKGWTVGL
ncbi:hypothetical protein [Algoriella sp.]|uniref:hypothetical protein n=1 Tax=Algoriella sp. TaxID=1872434 RepID=UPI001B0BF949|nr:hypothetical protein [Algoriella sp.]MBO6212452.1 hypothetical protein [Algoriella sp.]